jgi:hypothetical protein
VGCEIQMHLIDVYFLPCTRCLPAWRHAAAARRRQPGPAAGAAPAASNDQPLVGRPAPVSLMNLPPMPSAARSRGTVMRPQ